MTKPKEPTDKDILKEMEKDTDAGAIEEEMNEEKEDGKQKDRGDGKSER